MINGGNGKHLNKSDKRVIILERSYPSPTQEPDDQITIHGLRLRPGRCRQGTGKVLIVICVSARPVAGKSTLMALVAKAIEDRCQIYVHDPDHDFNTVAETLEDRVSAVADKRVLLRELVINREP